MMLATFIFYLTGAAKTSFNNNEEELMSCRQCRITRFVRPIIRKPACCPKELAIMTEADKVAHLLKGIADDEFSLVVFKHCSTVLEIIIVCR